ncbi:dnaJ homolog subfamily C member 30, mitochondrial-like isoform X2 [Condylostylus longicornis]|uniref:dnaJ homolog subfamily C member 30, mitochondrial-like isoform X2 n=1 Tax=Condylostylus longicornis TaxID=2530218 RepID=UPI00244E0C80|nr:dnaJ homolog subfamily C member 30, mitochondrial-like isoform X2 [Condylostylus longicornis]
MLSSKCSRSLLLGTNQHSVSNLLALLQRGIRISVFNMNHYKALGLPPNATQNDIKAAYYKLSMLYHPDKNKGSDDAAKKFREITAAYEVLGNLRLRRLYDKGIIHTAGAQYASEPQFEEDDPQTKFYKAREKRAEVPHAEGKTTIYDFDEWSQAHYGSTFDRKQKAKKRHCHF